MKQKKVFNPSLVSEFAFHIHNTFYHFEKPMDSQGDSNQTICSHYTSFQEGHFGFLTRLKITQGMNPSFCWLFRLIPCPASVKFKKSKNFNFDILSGRLFFWNETIQWDHQYLIRRIKHLIFKRHCEKNS